jgi:hypothetical protein
MNDQPSATTPGEARWKEMVAHLAARVGMTPLDVEAATEGRVKAADVSEILTRVAEAQAEAASPPDDRADTSSSERA